jgi:Peptidase A4 family/Putative Ig domain
MQHPPRRRYSANLSASSTMSLTVAGVLLLAVCVALPSFSESNAGNQTSPGAADQPGTWSPLFDKIKDQQILQVLHEHEKDWAGMFRASGKSAEQLIFEGNLELQRLRNQIAADDSMLRGNTAGSSIAPAASQCKTVLSNVHDPLFAACDKQVREDQLLAVSGMLELLPHYAKQLPPAVHTGRYGMQPGKEVVGKIAVRVVPPPAPNPAILNITKPDSQAYVVTPADNKRAIEVEQGQDVIVRFIAKGRRSPGFIVTPATGVLEAQPGILHYPSSRFIVLKAVKVGNATIEFTGPLTTEINESGCMNCWSGYITGGGPFFGVQGSWVVPKIDTQSSPYGDSATWVGLDGFGEPQLIQTGTEQDYSNGFFGIGGGVSYSAWWEILPQASTPIQQPVYPGDAILASISPTPGSVPSPNSNSLWQIELINLTRHWSFVTTQKFSGPLDEAEWIEEDPTLCDGGCSLAPFTDYGQVLFDFFNRVALSPPAPPQFTLTWVSPNLAPTQKSSIDQNGFVFSTPSDPDADLDGFYVTYTQAGPNQVAPPAPWVEDTPLPPALVNQPYSQQLSAFVEDNSFEPNGPSWSWAIVGGVLPSGLSLDSSTGTISGTPTQVGTFNFSVLATDTVTTAFSQTNNFALVVTSQAAAIFTLQCGAFTPPSPGSGFALTFRGASTPCNSTFVLDPGTYSVSATLTGVRPGTYKILFGGSCNSAGQVTLTQGQVVNCVVQAESLSLIENAGCTIGQRCCEPSINGCKRCIASNKSCP